MKSRQPTTLALLTLGFLLPLGTGSLTAQTKEAAPTAAAPVADLAKLEADVGLSAEQKTEVNALLAKLKTGRRAVKDDASLSPAEKKAKNAAVDQEIFAKIKALMTPEQYARWEKHQAAIRASRRK